MRRKLEVKIERSAEDMAIDDSKCKNPPQVRVWETKILPLFTQPRAHSFSPLLISTSQGAVRKETPPANLHESQIEHDEHAETKQPETPNRPNIDAKPMIRVRNPPGGKSSIGFF